MNTNGNPISKVAMLARFTISHLQHNHRASGCELVKPYVKSKVGLEIGGLSDMFSRIGILPIYPLAKSVDNCNIVKPKYRLFYLVRGTDYMKDGIDLSFLGNKQYDFVLSSHTIEHIANPLKALVEWKGKLKLGGALIVICPHRDYTLDHNRPITPFAHIYEDWENYTQESDTTHFAEIAELTDCIGSKQEAQSTAKAIRLGLEHNVTERVLHHHTFIPESLVDMFEWVELKIIYLDTVMPHHIVIVGVKK